MILFAGALILVWLIALAATAMHLSGMRWRVSWVAVCGLLICLLPVLLFLLRPDEEMEAGEDPAGYLHRAISLAREQRLGFVDAGLALVSAEERPLFRYGHAGFLATKDAVLWSPNMQSMEVGPHFQPIPFYYRSPYRLDSLMELSGSARCWPCWGRSCLDCWSGG